MSQYLGRGAKSRGRMTITKGLNTEVSTAPYLRDNNDVEAVIKGIESLQEALSGVEGLEWAQPPPDMTAREFVEGVGVRYFWKGRILLTVLYRWSSRPPTAVLTTGSVSLTTLYRISVAYF